MGFLVIFLVILGIVVIVGREFYLYDKSSCEDFHRSLTKALNEDRERIKAGKPKSGEVIRLLKKFYGQG